jgi:hypothetical protein
MVSTSTSIIAASVAVAACISRVNAHGYMLIPETQFDGSANSAWIVQIDPTWASDDWNGNSEESVTTYQTLAAENDVTYIRTLLDDTSIYGADCGYSNPDGTAQSIPTDSTATFSRAIQHVVSYRQMIDIHWGVTLIEMFAGSVRDLARRHHGLPRRQLLR